MSIIFDDVKNLSLFVNGDKLRDTILTQNEL